MNNPQDSVSEENARDSNSENICESDSSPGLEVEMSIIEENLRGEEERLALQAAKAKQEALL
jgi:hypothetical protein